MLFQIARVGVMTGTSLLVGNIVKPIMGTAGAIGRSISVAAAKAERASEYAELASQTHHTMKLMDLEIEKRTHLLDYADSTKAIGERWQDLSDNLKDAVIKWEERFPKL